MSVVKSSSSNSNSQDSASDHEYIKRLGLSPQDLVKDYINARALSVGPQARLELEKLVGDAREDAKNLARMIRYFEGYNHNIKID